MPLKRMNKVDILVLKKLLVDMLVVEPTNENGIFDLANKIDF